MKAIKFLSIAAIALMLASCGGKKEAKQEEKVEARTVEIPTSAITLEGEGAEYFEIDGESITITGTPGGYQSDVVTELTVKPVKNFDDLYGFVHVNGYPFTLKVYGADNTELGSLTYYTHEDLKKLEDEMKNGTNNPVKIKLTSRMTAEEYNKFFDNAKSGKSEVAIEMQSNADRAASGGSDDEIIGGDEEGEDTSEVAEASTSSDNNWDSILDEYESYVTKLASINKKAKSGDASAAAELASASADCISLSDKLANAKGSMTSAQAARYARIQAKYVKAMQ